MNSLAQTAVNLTIRNRGGSVEHFYHFLLGFLFPLAIAKTRLDELGFSGPIYVRSCGPMDRILAELAFPNVRIVEKTEHLYNSSRTSIDGRPLVQKSVSGMDFTNGNYPAEGIIKAKDIIRAHLSLKITALGYTQSNRKGVLLINRSINSFYSSPSSEIKAAGLQRRSISNFSDVEMALRRNFTDVNSVVLEHSPFMEQIYLFGSSDIIVAQHGAALTNIVWCKPNTLVVEIAPTGYRTTCFPPLSRHLGLIHRLVRQDGMHGDCDISDLISKVAL